MFRLREKVSEDPRSSPIIDILHRALELCYQQNIFACKVVKFHVVNIVEVEIKGQTGDRDLLFCPGNDITLQNVIYTSINFLLLVLKKRKEKNEMKQEVLLLVRSTVHFCQMPAEEIETERLQSNSLEPTSKFSLFLCFCQMEKCFIMLNKVTFTLLCDSHTSNTLSHRSDT